MSRSSKRFFRLSWTKRRTMPGRLGLGRVALECRHYREALDFLNRATQDRRTVKEAWRRLQNIHRLEGRFDEAERAALGIYNKLPEDSGFQDPILLPAMLMLTGRKFYREQADAYYAGKNYEETVQVLEILAAEYPDDPECQADLGRNLVVLASGQTAQRAGRSPARASAPPIGNR